MKKTICGAAGIFFVMAGSVFAGDTINGAGVGTGMSKNAVTMLGANHMLVKTENTYDGFKMENPAHPYNRVSGECFGSMEIKPPSASGGGNCVYTDDAGDVSAIRFDVTGMSEEGAMVGNWTVIGGTGKFENASGSGGFSSKTNRDTGVFENTVTGEMVMMATN